jgi:hypothetical protein
MDTGRMDTTSASDLVLAALTEYCSSPLSAILARGASLGQAEQNGEPEPPHLRQEVLRLFRATVSVIRHGTTRAGSPYTSSLISGASLVCQSCRG